MSTIKNINFVAKAAKALGETHRLLIFKEITRRGSINCTQAQQLTNLAQPSVSHHIRTLVNSGLVDTEKIGREVNLVVNEEKMAEFLSTMSEMNAPAATTPATSNASQSYAEPDQLTSAEGKAAETAQPGTPKAAGRRNLLAD
jgi:ArsR family transcriptional regulator